MASRKNARSVVPITPKIEQAMESEAMGVAKRATDLAGEATATAKGAIKSAAESHATAKQAVRTAEELLAENQQLRAQLAQACDLIRDFGTRCSILGSAALQAVTPAR